MSNRKRTFFTSDWHCFHKNCLKFDNRPFRDIDHMHRVLIKNYNSVMNDNSICYFLGDMGLCGTANLKSIIDQLNGTKVIVLGNHDKGSNAMYSMGFDVVLYGARLKIAGELVDLTHCPLRGIKREDTTGMKGSDGTENWHNEHKHIDFSVENTGQFCLSGHIHSPNGGKSKKILGRQYDVGVVNSNYALVSLGTIESWIVKTKKDELND